MASMFAKLKKAKDEEEEHIVTLRDIAKANDERYYICTENGKMIACGVIDEIYSMLPPDYQSKQVHYWYYDPVRDSVKVVF